MKFKENQTPTKLRGSYYTPHSIATFLNKWILAKNPKIILEPSCGDGAFFNSITQLNHDSISEIWGFEIDGNEAFKAKESLKNLKNIKKNILNEDFLDWYVSKTFIMPFADGVIGNPPFIRYQYLEDKQQQLAKIIFSQFNLEFTKHTNAWVPFVIASIALLKAGGRIGMVLPSELLHVLHASSLRAFLASQCSRILIIDPQKLWFVNTLQGALLILAEKKQEPDEKSLGLHIVSTNSDEILTENPEDLFYKADYVNGEVLRGKWMKALLSPKERSVLNSSIQFPQIYKFKDIAEVAVGIVTGANNYFLVSDEVVEEYELNNWAYPMFGRSDHVPGIIYDEFVHNENKTKGKPTNFIWFKDEEKHQLPLKVQEYLEFGESNDFHKRYKCRIREPWYGVPSVYSTNIGMLKRCHNFPRLILNKIQAFTTDTAYRIQTKGTKPESLVFSFINSLSALTAELEGRHYGGGVLELVPSEIRKLYIPIVDVNTENLIELDEMIKNHATLDDIFEKQNSIILKNCGLNNSEIITLHEALNTLRLRRQRSD